ncbi:MAG: helix-turn-helix transcriptional regulator [Jatrophihabitantaceae bacterium]
MTAAVLRAIDTMWEKYDQPLSLSELADEALFSRFYFSRIFRTETGTSPGRFLTSIRLFRAKNLLLETSLSVTDISYLVGYNSPGTFSTRFTLTVGMSPARYRHEAKTGFRSPAWRPLSDETAGSIEFTALLPVTDLSTRTYVGVFGQPFQSAPIACEIFERPGRYRVAGVPDGDWTIRAVTVATAELTAKPWQRRPLLVSDPVRATVRAGCGTSSVRLILRPHRGTDVPVLLIIPELDSFQPPLRQLDRSAGNG